MTRTFTLLSTLPEGSYKINRCSSLLPNSLQCWKPGAVLVRETTEVPATETAPATTSVNEYQLCKWHAVVLEQQDKTATTAQAEVSTLQTELAKEKQLAELQALPVAENSPNNQ